MTFVVGKACVDCKYGDCVDVCPVECFYEGPDMLYINPAECIDCTACEPVCPVAAITAEDLAEKRWVQKNAAFDFTDENRRSRKEDVSHGPLWDAELAGE